MVSSWTYKASPELSDTQFGQWQELLEQRTGIRFSLHKSILQAGLYRRMQEIRCDDYEEYFQRVQEGPAGLFEWSELLNRITIRETRFFRDRPSFDFLHDYLLQRLAESAARSGTLELWSAGCATGEEAYSLAIQAQECVDLSGARVYYGVTGTDISSAALAHAREGIYRTRQLEHLSENLRERMTIDAGGSRRQVGSVLRERVCFVQANLMQPQRLPMIAMDVIYCQNVLIYFSRTSQKEVLDGFVERLKPGGLLIVGHGEAQHWRHPQLTRVRSSGVQAYIRH